MHKHWAIIYTYITENTIDFESRSHLLFFCAKIYWSDFSEMLAAAAAGSDEVVSN